MNQNDIEAMIQRYTEAEMAVLKTYLRSGRDGRSGSAALRL